MYVAVVGPGDADEGLQRVAEEVGRHVGGPDVTIVCGGLGGVMAAACKGAKSAGATTLGLLPGNDQRDANPWIDVAVATGLGEGRNALVVRNADVVIAIGRGFGTLSEIALALRRETPVIGLATWDIPGVRPAEDAGKAAALAKAFET